LKLGLPLSMILVAGALSGSGSLAEEAVPAAKEAVPAAKQTVPASKETTTARPSTNAGSQGSLPGGGTANSAHGSAIEGSAGSKGSADTAGAKGKAGGKAAGGVSEKAGGGSKEIGSGTNPIDTRITVQPGRAVKKPPPGDEKKTKSPAAPPSVNSARPTIPHDMGGSARNAIGIPLDHHASAKGASPGPQGHGPPAAADGIAKNAIGALGNHYGSAGGADIMCPKSSPAVPASTPHNRAVITGTGMSRPGSGPGALGGPAKNAAALNGTNIRPKR
jgi:hypothetical protein